MKQCPNHPADHREFVTAVTEQHSWVVTPSGEMILDLGCDQMLRGPDNDNAWVCSACGAEAVDVVPIKVTISQGVATLEDGTTSDLAPIQAYMAGCYKNTAYPPYAEAADSLSRLTGINWRDQ
jgi:hypothetical protein